MNRRTLTMNWDGLGEDDDDDRFFETYNRLSAAVPLDLASSGSEEDEDFEDSRMSFVSAISSASIKSIHPIDAKSSILANYDMWMSEPGDITERRKRLLQGMGLSSTKDLIRLASTKVVRAMSRKPESVQVTEPGPEPDPSSSPPTKLESKRDEPSPVAPIVLVRSRSNGDIDEFSAKTKQRKEELIGPVSKQRLTRSSSGQLLPSIRVSQFSTTVTTCPTRAKKRSAMPSNDVLQTVSSEGAFGSFFLIKNLDTGKEFIVKEYNEEGMWNKLSDVQTGKQLTMEEFEKSVGYSPVVKELMRRQNVSRGIHDDGRKINNSSYFSKSFRNSRRKGAALLKNIKGVATSMGGLIVDKEHEFYSAVDQKAPKSMSQWVKARQHGKSYKEFTALHMSQEIQAHEGSIWTMRFSSDGHFLATAGEDRMIHVWEVQECEVMALRPGDDASSAFGTPVHPMAVSAFDSPVHPMAASPFGTPVHPMAAGNVSDRPPIAEITPMPSQRKVVDWIHLREMVTAVCYTPDGQGAVVGSHQGSCRMYDIQEYKLEQRDEFQIKMKAKKITFQAPGKKTTSLQSEKITGLQFAPGNPSELLVTSANSRIRIYNGMELVQKFRGFRNTSSQISASFSPDGRNVISASEDSQVYIWKVDDSKNHGGTKGRNRITVNSHEHFPCKDITVAIPWPGSTKIEPPIVEIHSKRHSKRSHAPVPQSVNSPSTSEDNIVGTSSRRHLPPLPKKNNAVLERTTSCPDEDFAHSARIDPGIGASESFSSFSASISYADSPSISTSANSSSQSWSSSRFLPDNGSGGGHGGQTVQAAAWGLVIVTASVEGEIRIYQNFGFPDSKYNFLASNLFLERAMLADIDQLIQI